MRKRKPLRRRVLRFLLLADLERVDAEATASRMCMSSSTLRRRLRAEGTSYQVLLDAVRVHRCDKVLARTSLPGKTLALEMGFSEPNSFYRAFHRWHGKSLTRYRCELQRNGAR
ncbi:AraC family transcriptional regulator [Halieaceae bacterium IMCC14734]|uniref:AraC family transcriptional regulator n=1 Tax=Candidatus Litorirhabdus singularis TaxID=2518993 RepID=A0ABT3TMZ1_9GAMM|nr:AraC family transcriptional regulator [Candidatus Litorirhabdus singularis]MCX2982739.1 AraC family transcriptional regulator [Candidatus Litorirhabdus singularis]